MTGAFDIFPELHAFFRFARAKDKKGTPRQIIWRNKEEEFQWRCALVGISLKCYSCECHPVGNVREIFPLRRFSLLSVCIQSLSQRKSGKLRNIPIIIDLEIFCWLWNVYFEAFYEAFDVSDWIYEKTVAFWIWKIKIFCTK